MIIVETTPQIVCEQDGPLKKLSRILTLSALLSAPFVAHAEPDDDLNLPLGSNPIAISQTEVLPSVLMSEELMFKYLSAELADQRGNAFAAYSTMLSIARTTRDPRLARRAVEMAMKGKLVVEALKAARAWQEISPQSDEVAQLVLSLQLATNQTEEAKKVLAKRLAGATAQSLPGTVAQVQRLLSRMTDKAKSASLLRELLEPLRRERERAGFSAASSPASSSTGSGSGSGPGSPP